jgi:signal transduction histidine kinase
MPIPCARELGNLAANKRCIRRLNAFKLMQMSQVSGSQVCLRHPVIHGGFQLIEAAGKGAVNVRMDQCEDEIVTAIIDSGVGIPEADLPHVFEEFYRASNVKQEGITGTGLGLAIVKDLVERYEGRWLRLGA